MPQLVVINQAEVFYLLKYMKDVFPICLRMSSTVLKNKVINMEMYSAHAEPLDSHNIRMCYTVPCSARPQAFKGAINLH